MRFPRWLEIVNLLSEVPSLGLRRDSGCACMRRWKWSKQFGQLLLTSWGSFCLGETSLLLKIAETNRPQIIPVRFAWIYSSPFKIIFYFENNPINSFTKSSWESRYLCLFTRGVQFIDSCFSSVKSLFSLHELSRRRRRGPGGGGGRKNSLTLYFHSKGRWNFGPYCIRIPCVIICEIPIDF